MRINIQTDVAIPSDGARVGNVYPVKGGYGARDGQMMVIVAINAGIATLLKVDKEGNIKGATTYGCHVFEDRTLIAFVEGLEDLELVMRSI